MSFLNRVINRIFKWIFFLNSLGKKKTFFKNSIDDFVEKGRISSTDRGEKEEILCIFPSMTSWTLKKKGKSFETLVFEWSENWMSNKFILFERIFFTILGLPFHHVSIKISNSPPLYEEKISSNNLKIIKIVFEPGMTRKRGLIFAFFLRQKARVLIISPVVLVLRSIQSSVFNLVFVDLYIVH